MYYDFQYNNLYCMVLLYLLGIIEVEIYEDSDGYVIILGYRFTFIDWQKLFKCENFFERVLQKVKKEEG